VNTTGFAAQTDMVTTLDGGLTPAIEVVRDLPRFTAPEDSSVRNIEGWILGMEAHTGPANIEVKRKARRTPKEVQETESSFPLPATWVASILHDEPS